MNKHEFMGRLWQKTGNLPASEREEIIGYFDEIIADKLDRGMTEEYIMNELGEPEQLVDEMLANMETDRRGNDNQRADNENYNDMRQQRRQPDPRYIEQTFKPEGIIEIRANDRNNGIKIEPSQDGLIHVKYFQVYEGEYKLYLDNDGVLNIQYQDIRKNRGFFDFINNWGDARKSLLIYIPQGCAARISAHTTNGGVRAEQVNPEVLELGSTNGGIHAEQIVCKKFSIHTTNGGLYTSGITAEEYNAHTTNGGVKIDNLNSSKAEIGSTNGKISIGKAYCKETIRVGTSNGGIHFDEIDSYDVSFKSSCGGIHGRLVGKALDYSSDCETKNGSCNIRFINPQANRKLFARTNNASINIEFTQQ